MQQIIMDLHKVLDKGTVIISGYEQKLNDLIRNTKAVKVQAELNSKKSLELAQREKNVSDIENASTHMTQAKALMESARSASEKLEADKEEFKNYSDEQNQLIATARANSKKEADSLEVARKNIEAEVSKRVNAILDKVKKV